MADADLELHIKEPERCVIVCGTCVFARTEEKEESHDDHVRDCIKLKNQKQKTYKLFFTNSTKNCTSPTRNARKENSD